LPLQNNNNLKFIHCVNQYLHF